MTIFDMLEQSGVLTLLGMGVVFGFLVVLVICVYAMGKVFQVLGLSKKQEPVAEAAVPAAQSTVKDSARVTAAITAAVNEYRKN